MALSQGLNLGGHVSLGAHPPCALQSVRDQGFSCVQIHASSPRTWRIPDKSEESLAEVCAAFSSTGLGLFLHAIYLINLASDDDEIYEKSIRILEWNMAVAGRLGASAVTFHVGSHTGRGLEAVRSRIAGAVERVLASAPDGPVLLLENSAGAGGCIGGSLGELGQVIADVGSPPNLGCCVDTAHAFAMGYDLRDGRGVARMLAEIDDSFCLSRLRLLHLNDSKLDLGSAKDRHENIGDGFIGEEGFARVLAIPELRSLPLILETPNIERRADELKLLYRLAGLDRRAA